MGAAEVGPVGEGIRRLDRGRSEGCWVGTVAAATAPCIPCRISIRLARRPLISVVTCNTDNKSETDATLHLFILYTRVVFRVVPMCILIKIQVEPLFPSLSSLLITTQVDVVSIPGVVPAV